ncbi:uncharacterized protein [Haliotis asinina]|uniref:uncharacterized protein n=1 Tax=Haliotis asinina TaxID=109174 RepID=UPI003532806F
MMKSFSAILMISALGVFQHGNCSDPIKPCIPKSTCSCVNADGLIDLHPLGNNDGTPRFRYIPDPDGKTFYSWNPCYGFDDAGCQDVAMCQIIVWDNCTTSESLGTQSNLKFAASSEHGLVFLYENTAGASSFSGSVIITCDADEEGIVTRRQDADSLNEVYLELRSKYACPQKINGSTSFPSTISTTKHQRPTTPAFTGTVTPLSPCNPENSTKKAVFDMNSIGALMIVVLHIHVLFL